MGPSRCLWRRRLRLPLADERGADGPLQRRHAQSANRKTNRWAASNPRRRAHRRYRRRQLRRYALRDETPGGVRNTRVFVRTAGIVAIALAGDQRIERRFASDHRGASEQSAGGGGVREGGNSQRGVELPQLPDGRSLRDGGVELLVHGE